jgi:magnesium transporter
MKRYELTLNQTRWVDLVHPSKKELESLADELKIPTRVLVNALDPEHLPKYETVNSTTVIFLRIIDPNKKASAANIQELTTKVTVLLQEGLILTIHRLDPEFIIQFRAECETEDGKRFTQKDLIKKIVTSSIMTFDEPLNILEKKAEEFEDKIFKSSKNKTIIHEGYYIKRQASAFRKVLKFSLDILNALNSHPEFVWRDFQGLRENAERFLFYTEDVLENVTGLLNLHISLSAQKTNEASFKTNEVMRVLTVFSIFFFPLNFLTGIYGMNFEYMPELKHPMGYTAILCMMVIISIAIFIWVARKGWMKNSEDKS